MIKKLKNMLWVMLIFVTSLHATTVYEDGEDGTTNGWRVRRAPAIITNVYSPSQESRAIRITNGGSSILGAITSDAVGSWNNRTEKTISWKMVVDNRYTVYVVLSTTKGIRYVFYNDLPRRYLFHGFEGGILHGLGGYIHNEYKGVWRTYTRNLETDLKDAEPDNELISVNGFIYNGSDASIDDIILYNPEETVYEDGEEGIVNWGVSDNNPAGATITNIPDAWDDHAQGNVIRFQGSGQDNGYTIGSATGEGAWNNTTQSILQWKSRYYENYEVRISVQTTLGSRDLLYVNTGRYTPSGGVQDNGQTIWHELGRGALVGLNNDRWRNGATNDFWQTVTRDLEQDLKDFEPNNSIVSVNAFTIRGSGLIDDVKMLSRPKVVPVEDDVVYEDAEDGNTEGWTIYDNTPAGATITNIEDALRGGQVIELRGTGRDNGFELGSRTGDGQWNNRNHSSIRWSMNFTEDFNIYVAIETQEGARYMLYTPTNTDEGKSGNYIRFGLGEGANSGTWQTFSRNLEDDLHQFEPNNELIAIHAFLVRGSGRLDDIKTLFSYEETFYEDAEDGNTNGWSIFANVPEGATITNVEDATRGSRVIQLLGAEKSNGYMLGDRGGDNAWNDTNNRYVRWSMNYNENFTIYISVETTNGRRYLVYSPRDDDRGLSGQYVLLGLGANADDGTWRTFTRNLAEDIARFEAGNELISVNAFMIRGSGRLDDILMFD